MTPETQPPDRHAGADQYILLVEDSDTDAVLTTAMLKRSGLAEIPVRRVDRIGDAVNHPDPLCIVVDLCLPDAEGPACVELLRRSFDDVPIIVYTGRDDPSAVAASRRAGADGYVTKGGVGVDRLADAIRATLDARRTGS